MARVLDLLPRGDMVDDAAWSRRHHFLLVVLLVAAPVLCLVGLVAGDGPWAALSSLFPLAIAASAWRAPGRRAGSLIVTAGLALAGLGLIVLSGGSTQAYLSLFVVVAVLVLYQDWRPLAVMLGIATLGLGLGTVVAPSMIFDHDARTWPWPAFLVRVATLLLMCLAVAIPCRLIEDGRGRRGELAEDLDDGGLLRQRFTSELLLNLARRNQSMFHRQLDIINGLEERERDPDALADLFRLDHLATRMRRNAESLLVLSGEQPARMWSAPVALRDVVRAGVAETEDLDRVSLAVDERTKVVGSCVADLTHMVAELVENATCYSPPSTPVVIQTRTYHRAPGAHLLIIEDAGIGMPPAELAAANELLADPHQVDVSGAARQLGFHVVSRLAERHGITVSLTPTPGCGVTAVLQLPAALFAESAPTVPAISGRGIDRVPALPKPRRGSADDHAAAERGDVSARSHQPVGRTGRHYWPGRTGAAETEGQAGPDEPPGATPVRRPAHAAPGDGNTPAEGGGDAEGTPDGQPRAGAGEGQVTVEVAPASGGADGGQAGSRHGLIHPIVVPPPAPSDDPSDGASGAPPASAASAPPTARRVTASPPSPGATTGDVADGYAPDGTAPDAPAPRHPAEEASAVVGSNGVVLARRRPQTHLAPELIRRLPGVPAATAPAPASTGIAPGSWSGSDPHRSGAGGGAMTERRGRLSPPPADQGAASALSAYQASRSAARSAIGEDGPTGSSEHPHHGSTTGRQT